MDLLAYLERTTTSDPEARNMALFSVNAMLKQGTRAGALLRRAEVAVKDATVDPSLRSQRTASLAAEAYEARTNAEVAKHRAVFSILAEQAGNEGQRWNVVAAQAARAQGKRSLINDTVDQANEKSRYHGKQRNLMMQAAKATEKALQYVPPLPGVSAPRVTGSFAGFGFGGLGAEVSIPQTEYHGSPALWEVLKTSFTAGVEATGRAAAIEGKKVSGQDPAGGFAIETGGNLLANLTRMLGISEQKGVAEDRYRSNPSGYPWHTAIIGGGLLIGGFFLWRALR